MSESHTHLTLSTARINRLLRPLRNKCGSLASFSPPHPAATRLASTYATRPRAASLSDWRTSPPPLMHVGPPEAIVTDRRFEKNRAGTLELAQRLYAVRDCFRNIVQVAFDGGSHGVGPAVPSLAALCSIVIGRHIQPELDSCTAGSEHEDELTEAVNEIYEAVPLHNRRWTLVSHALQTILDMCPHHTTLLTLLLEVTLSKGLLCESDVLLRALLVAACSPVGGLGPPLCHRAHGSYLTDLRNTWTVAGFTDGSFVRVLTDVLLEDGREEVWGSKAVYHILHHLHVVSLPLFMYALVGLAEAVGAARGVRSEGEGVLLAVMEAMVGLAMDKAFMCIGSSATSHSFDVGSLVSFLECSRAVELHVHGGSDSVSDVLVCLATYLLAECQSRLTTGDMVGVVELLREAIPVTWTYDQLIAHVFDVNEHPKTYQTRLAHCKSGLEELSAMLRSHGLLHLEASLLACGLRHIERSDGKRVVDACGQGLKEWRQELISAVDDAEGRCFGEGREGGRRVSRQEWEWEEMVGSWVEKRPRKKGKFEDGVHPRCSKRPRCGPDKFMSIISDALSQRTVLHVRSNEVGRRRCADDWAQALSSDDALNLFAYND